MYFPFHIFQSKRIRDAQVKPEPVPYRPPIHEISQYIIQYIGLNKFDQERQLFVGEKEMTLECANDLYDNQ